MGVRTTTYLIYGFVLNKEQETYVDEHWEDENMHMLDYVEQTKEARGHILLMDGMCGEYTIFGKVLCANDECEDVNIKKVFIPNYDDKKDVMNHFMRCFPEHIKFENELDLMLVTHYS